MKGILLSGGRGTRLFPLTLGVSKQLLPVYRQPLVFFPLKTLINLGIDEILVIVASELQKTLFYEYLGDGKKFGVRLEYVVQEKPNGLAEAFIIGEKFIGKDDVAMILGDNVLLESGPIDVSPNTVLLIMIFPMIQNLIFTVLEELDVLDEQVMRFCLLLLEKESYSAI